MRNTTNPQSRTVSARSTRVTVNADAVIDPPDSASADTNTAPKRVIGRPFAPGNNANPKGRPRKGESVGEKYIKQLEKNADALIEKHIKRAMGDNVVAERAFTTALAYAVGLPKQTFVHQLGADPYLELMQGIEAVGGMRQLPPAAIDADITPTT